MQKEQSLRSQADTLADVEFELRKLLILEALQMVQDEVHELTALLEHQQSEGLSYEDTKGRIAAFAKVRAWLYTRMKILDSTFE